MKRTLIALSAALAIASSASAYSSFDLGWSSNSFDNYENNKNGVYIGFKFAPYKTHGFFVGLDTDFEAFKVGDSGAYNIGINLLAGYDFTKTLDIPLVLSAGAGYGSTYISDIQERSSDPQYNVSAEFGLSKSFGLGVRYSVKNSNFSTVDTKYTSTSAYILFKWN